MKRRHTGAAFALLILLAVGFLFLNICIGSVALSFKEIWHAYIVLNIRLPRALAALVLGGALALAGYLLQTFFHNPIAGPFILGISSGAKLMVAAVMVFTLGA